MPAKAGICVSVKVTEIPAFAGMTVVDHKDITTSALLKTENQRLLGSAPLVSFRPELFKTWAKERG